jgi:hypothetical protein
VEDDAADRADDLDAELEQSLAQRGHLGASTRRGAQPEFRMVVAPRRYCRNDGPATATVRRSGDRQEFLDPIFDVAAGAVTCSDKARDGRRL